MPKKMDENISAESGLWSDAIKFYGKVKKRGQLNTAYKERFFVLKDEVLEYYEDKKAYLTKKRGGLKGSVSTKNITVTPATLEGVQESNGAYHFTLATEAGKTIECTCESKAERDLWVHELQEGQRIFFEGNVKKRGGQFNTSYKVRFFVLKHDVLEYYEDKKAYLTKKRGGLRGSISTKNITVTPGTPGGVLVSNNGYHFTVGTQAPGHRFHIDDGKIMECACESERERDKWVHKLQQCQREAALKYADPLQDLFSGDEDAEAGAGY
jgi:hypothetical protein